MSRIFISTNLNSAQSCFNGTDEDNIKELKVISILKINMDLTIQQFEETQVLFHFDQSNPMLEIDGNNDLLLYHSQTDGFMQQKGFIHRFKKKEYSNHPGKFKSVFELLIDDSIQDKYGAIKSAIFPSLNQQIIGQIGGQFLENGGIEIERIKNILGKSYNVEVENLINQNLNYHQKKADKSNTKEDDNQNNENWYVLEKMLKSSNG